MKMNRLIPMLPVKRLSASIDFYQKLGFTIEKKNDGWGWAMMRFDECRLMLDQSIYRHGGGSSGSVVYLYPDDLGQYHRQVRQNGLSVPDLDDTFYGMKEFRLDDPDGNRLWIGESRPA